MSIREPTDGFERMWDAAGSPAFADHVAGLTAHTGKIAPEVLSHAAAFSQIRKSKIQRQLAGFSAAIAGYMALGWCYVYGLGDFLQEPDSMQGTDGASTVPDPIGQVPSAEQ